MNDFLPALHWLGTKPLTVSLVAQTIALVISLKKGEKSNMRQHVTLLVALTLIVVSLGMRPPSPLNLPADIMGTVAALLLLQPAIHAVRHYKDPA